MERTATDDVGKHGEATMDAPKVADAKAQTMIAPIACDDSRRNIVRKHEIHGV